MRIVSRVSVVAALASLGLVLGACGDDAQAIDASVPDMMAPDMMVPDAAPPGPTRSGTIAVLDLRLTNPGYDTFSGAAVNISYNDITPETVNNPMYAVDPVFDNRSAPPFLFGCVVWVYDVGQTNTLPTTDEGSVEIGGTLSPIGTCSYDGTDYVCSTGGGVLPANALLVPNGDGTVTLSLPNTEFLGKDLVGARLNVQGFAEPANNGTFPVVAQVGGSTAVIVNPLAVNDTLAQDSPYVIITGAGPTPASRDFLDDGTVPVTMDKAASAEVDAVAASLGASGEGLVLAGDSAHPEALPISPPADAKFSCDAANGGNCGPLGGAIAGWVLSGSTTDAPVTGAIDMPDPVGQWARFQCRGNIGMPAVTLPAGAIQAILDTNPTRIETQIFRITADITQPDTSCIAGHGLIGYTDVP